MKKPQRKTWEKDITEMWELNRGNSEDVFTLHEFLEYIRLLLSQVESQGIEEEIKKSNSGRRMFQDGIKVGGAEEREDIIKELKRRIDKLYCTEEELGYHDKNCEGCEKGALKKLITALEKRGKKI